MGDDTRYKMVERTDDPCENSKNLAEAMLDVMMGLLTSREKDLCPGCFWASISVNALSMLIESGDDEKAVDELVEVAKTVAATERCSMH
jgi:hypothetical protein